MCVTRLTLLPPRPLILFVADVVLRPPPDTSLGRRRLVAPKPTYTTYTRYTEISITVRIVCRRLRARPLSQRLSSLATHFHAAFTTVYSLHYSLRKCHIYHISTPGKRKRKTQRRTLCVEVMPVLMNNSSSCRQTATSAVREKTRERYAQK